MPYLFEHTVRFQDIDGAGIMFFGQLFDYCHYAFEELLSDAGIPFAELLQSRSWAMPLVHAEADYRRPLRHGDRVRIAVELARVGTTSITFAYRVESAAPPHELRATASLVHVIVDLASFERRPIPAELLAGLTRVGLHATAP